MMLFASDVAALPGDSRSVLVMTVSVCCRITFSFARAAIKRCQALSSELAHISVPCIPAGSTSPTQVASPPNVPKQSAAPNSIVLEQNGERRILKKIKLLKGSPKFRAKPPEPVKKVEPPAAPLVAKKMFVCTFCQSRFDCHGKLQVHFLKHGSSPGTGKNPERSALVLIECEWCPETFTTMSKAIEHKYRKHNYEAKNYFCKLCGRLFPLRVALEQHQALEHKGETVEEVRGGIL
ncbi:hypothetical protein quinque_016455 [Culex quinquefasciatus]